MPLLIRNIEATVLDFVEGSVKLTNDVSGQVGIGEYIKINTFVIFNQNFSRVSESESIDNPIKFGLKNNSPRVDLEISY